MKKCERGDEITGAYHDGHSPAPMALRALLELRRAVGGDGGLLRVPPVGGRAAEALGQEKRAAPTPERATRSP